MNELERLKRENERLSQELAGAVNQIAGLKSLIERLGGERREKAPKSPGEGRLALEVNRLTEELSEREFRRECDLAVAREIQSKLLPSSLPDLVGLRVQTLYRPSALLGGDFYDLVLPEPGVLAILLADASPTGLTAAVVSVMAKIAYTHSLTHHKTPKGVLKEVNQHLVARCMEGQYLAGFLAFIDIHSRRMRFCNAGLCAPVLCGRKRFEVLDTEGSFLGAFEDANLHEREVQLNEGDRIVLYTDGIRRLKTSNGRAYNAGFWDEAIRDKAALTLDAFLREIDRDVASRPDEPSDDVTVVGIEVTGREAHTQRFVILSDPQELHGVEEAILKAMDRRGYGERDRFGVKLSLEEAVTNAIRHGNLMDRRKRVTIDFSINDRELMIAVEDEGAGFDPAKVADPTRGDNLERPSGRGIVLMRAYMDEVEFVKPGNKVIIRKRAPWA